MVYVQIVERSAPLNLAAILRHLAVLIGGDVVVPLDPAQTNTRSTPRTETVATGRVTWEQHGS